MKYKAYKLCFQSGVHIGNKSLDEAETIMRSDSFFSALCSVAAESEENLSILYNCFNNGELCTSDLFPYVNDTYFIPKPFCRIETTANDGDSVKKKQFKKLKFISAEGLNDFLSGNYDPKEDLQRISKLGEKELRTNVGIRNGDKNQIFNTGVFNFNNNCGLYVIVGYNSEKALEFFEKYFILLSYSGIGGKRSSGLGKFSLAEILLPTQLLKSISSHSNTYMLLSTALPHEDEFEKSIENAEYSLIKRGGFSSVPGRTSRRNQDVYMFTSGSCFKNRFSGSILNVSLDDEQAIYRCGKPLWMGVNK